MQGNIFCGRQDKHKHDFMARLKKLKEKESQLTKDIALKEDEVKQLHDFQSRSTSVFTTTLTPRMIAAFPERYSCRTQSGKVSLQRDISILRQGYNNKAKNIPAPSTIQADREEFSRVIKEQMKLMKLENDTITNSDEESCTKIYNILMTSPVKSGEDNVVSDVEMKASCTGKRTKKSLRSTRKAVARPPPSDKTCANDINLPSSSDEDEVVPRRKSKPDRNFASRDDPNFYPYTPPWYPYGFHTPVGYMSPPTAIHSQFDYFHRPMQVIPPTRPSPMPFREGIYPGYGMGFLPQQVTGHQNTGNVMGSQFVENPQPRAPEILSSFPMPSRPRDNQLQSRTSETMTAVRQFTDNTGNTSEVGSSDYQRQLGRDRLTETRTNTAPQPEPQTQPTITNVSHNSDGANENTSNMNALFEAALLLQNQTPTTVPK
ncbi:uncharacterized protein [Ptychodera flava]|uniref:uncharacterized protein n=1 Tax=Ptychodera flava TaxID=63121 RepID=UPI00396A3725